MGTFRVEVEASNLERTVKRAVTALVDSGATYTMLNASVLRELSIEPHSQRTFVLANGSRVVRDIGRAWLRVDGREEFTIVVFGDDGAESLLGAVTLEELGLGIDPVGQKVVPVDALLMGHSPDVSGGS
jgi:predicted aspartyl protease